MPSDKKDDSDDDFQPPIVVVRKKMSRKGEGRKMNSILDKR